MSNNNSEEERTASARTAVEIDERKEKIDEDMHIEDDGEDEISPVPQRKRHASSITADERPTISRKIRSAVLQSDNMMRDHHAKLKKKDTELERLRNLLKMKNEQFLVRMAAFK